MLEFMAGLATAASAYAIAITVDRALITRRHEAELARITKMNSDMMDRLMSRSATEYRNLTKTPTPNQNDEPYDELSDTYNFGMGPDGWIGGGHRNGATEE